MKGWHKINDILRLTGSHGRQVASDSEIEIVGTVPRRNNRDAAILVQKKKEPSPLPLDRRMAASGSPPHLASTTKVWPDK